MAERQFHEGRPAPESRRPRDIEREIEVERAELRADLDALSRRFSGDELARRASLFVQDKGAAIAPRVGAAIRDNPAAAILAGIGLGWLYMTARKERPVPNYGHGYAALDDRPAGRAERLDGPDTAASMPLVTDSIVQMPTDAPDVFAFRLSGTIDKDDIDAMGRHMNAQFDRFDKVSMLMLFEGFEGAEMSARFDWEHLKAQVRSLTNVDKYAVVGAPGAADTMIAMWDKVLPVDARAFDAHEAAEAWAFVGARPLGGVAEIARERHAAAV